MIVGYLVARFVGKAKHFADGKVEQLLDGLFERVWSKVGGEKALERLRADPGDATAQEWAASSIAQAGAADAAFAQQLAAIQRELHHRAPDLLVYAPGAGTVVGVNEGYLIQGGNVHISNHYGPDDPADLRGAPAWAKALVVLGAVLCVAGLGVFGYTMFTHNPGFDDPSFGETPPGIPMAFGIFFTGFVLAGVGGMASSLTKREPARAGR